ncbi:MULTISPECIES: hypothetical protein [unclassified Anabaena]|uniref:hypothetical protein n=1 Tax=unclassified Anabaena TaxID=2619674 RepID=UPI0014454551|nr:MULTISPECIES: hypothetical protein [unclassified Anabaena]MTJ07646.1 hypothetical protein [Anabaena sp. UHCC 0204]MTJ51386.1 hypothetical protein [Anabaena sp. UHCC 0253]
MSHQVMQSDLIVDLSTDEQEILTGGRYSPSHEEENGKFNGGRFNGSSSSDDDDDDECQKKDGKSKYNFLVYRPTIYNPKFYIKA